MTIQRVVKKSKLGMEDMALGEGTENQNRNGGIYPVTQVRFVYPANELAEINALDTTLYKKARLYAGDGVTPPTDYEYINGVWTQTSVGGGASFANLTEVLTASVTNNDIIQYDGETETWVIIDIADAIDLTANYPWTGSHSFSQYITLTNGAQGPNALGTANFNLIQNVDGAPVIGSTSKTPQIATVDVVNYNVAGTLRESFHEGNINKALTPISAKTADYTFGTGDIGYLITMDNAGANTLTIPLDTTADLPVGATVSVCQLGVGQTTIAGEVGVTTLSEIGLNIKGQYGFATLLKTAANTWLVTGSLAA